MDAADTQKRFKGVVCSSAVRKISVSTNRTIAKNASIVSGATLLSRVLGLVRDLIMAYALV